MKNRYGSNPIYCDIYNNHIDFNKTGYNNTIYYWNANLSCYNSGNKEWIYVTAGQEVEMSVKLVSGTPGGNFSVKLNPSTSTTAFLTVSISGKKTGTTTKKKVTASESQWVYMSNSFTCQGASCVSVDIEITIDGKRVL